MTKMEFPNKPGNVRVDDIEIYIFPDKIIVDTGNRQQTQPRPAQNRVAYKERKPKEETEKKPKKNDIVNSILDSCEAVVMGRKKVN